MDTHEFGGSTGEIVVGSLLERFGERAEAPIAEERLPFTIRVVRSDAQLEKAVFMRRSAYARHVPALAERLRVPEPYDYDEGSVVLLAESKLDESPLGTMRIQTNRYRRLAIEQSVRLPDWLRERSLAEATRLGIAEGSAGRLVKTMLFKAFFHYCRDAGIDWLVIGARPPLDRQYAALLFHDVIQGGALIPLRHAGDIPHRIMAFEIEAAEARWIEANHPLYDLFCRTRHPDIELDDGRGLLRRPNARSARLQQVDAGL